MNNDFSGCRAVVMGLGLNGGGLASAVFLARRGAAVTVTDLRGEEILAPSIEALNAAVRKDGTIPPRYVLGRHDIADFESANIVIKNPGVRPDSPYLKAARHIETDISLFLQELNTLNVRLCAVTGSKGKSFTSTALHFVLDAYHKKTRRGAAFLGGNITVSPLTFLSDIKTGDDVVLELSSWQLGDLPAGLLKPRVALITAIMKDHLDRYGTMEAYVADKKLIYKNQDANCITIAYDDEWGRIFLNETKARTAVYGANSPELAEFLPSKLRVPGGHQRINLLGAALALRDIGLECDFIADTLARFGGIEHRLELFYESDGVKYYNDSAATIPEAAAAAVLALGSPILVTGGTDKALDYTPLVNAASAAKKIILLAGTASDKLASLFSAAGLKFEGPFDKIESAAAAAIEQAAPGDNVVLSPGCTSFGMFLNEFDRGKKWKKAICG